MSALSHNIHNSSTVEVSRHDATLRALMKLDAKVQRQRANGRANRTGLSEAEERRSPRNQGALL